jgi:hypothetical protein
MTSIIPDEVVTINRLTWTQSFSKGSRVSRYSIFRRKATEIDFVNVATLNVSFDEFAKVIDPALSFVDTDIFVAADYPMDYYAVALDDVGNGTQSNTVTVEAPATGPVVIECPIFVTGSGVTSSYVNAVGFIDNSMTSSTSVFDFVNLGSIGINDNDGAWETFQGSVYTPLAAVLYSGPMGTGAPNNIFVVAMSGDSVPNEEVFANFDVVVTSMLTTDVVLTVGNADIVFTESTTDNPSLPEKTRVWAFSAGTTTIQAGVDYQVCFVFTDN